MPVGHSFKLPTHRLSKREREVINLRIEGHSRKEVAHRLRIAENTVSAHLSNAYNKLGVTNMAQLIAAYRALEEKPAEKKAASTT